MNWKLIAISGVLLVSACVQDAPQTLLYRGQEIRIAFGSKVFGPACHSESITLSPEEAARVERLLLGVPLPRKGLSHSEMVTLTSDIKFPGYGESDQGSAPQPDGTQLWLIQLEVPCRAKDRVIAFRVVKGAYYLVDDFVNQEQDGPLIGVSQSGTTMLYQRPGGRPPLVRTALTPNPSGA